METLYSIVEMFYSVQGEGKLVGTPMFFVRLFGCDLSCDFCDEPKHKDSKLIKRLTADDIINEAKLTNTEWVCVTGGEPSLRPINHLIGKLQDAGLKVAVESNGFRPGNIERADFLTLSPKHPTRLTKIGERKWDEVKLLISDEGLHFQLNDNDQATLDALFEISESVYVQPINDADSLNIDNALVAVSFVESHPETRLSLQIHKMIGVA